MYPYFFQSKHSDVLQKNNTYTFFYQLFFGVVQFFAVGVVVGMVQFFAVVVVVGIVVVQVVGEAVQTAKHGKTHQR